MSKGGSSSHLPYVEGSLFISPAFAYSFVQESMDLVEQRDPEGYFQCHYSNACTALSLCKQDRISLNQAGLSAQESTLTMSGFKALGTRHSTWFKWHVSQY